MRDLRSLAPIRLRYDTPAGSVQVRLVRRRDARALQVLLAENRGWLRPWEATHPDGRGLEPGSFSMRPSIRWALRRFRDGTSIPLVMEWNGEVAGQLTVSEISGGALRSAQLGYWLGAEFAGLRITPISVALTVDYLFDVAGLHRVEICLVPENHNSRRVVEKLGLRFEGVRERYIHINGEWADHEAYAVTREELPQGLLRRYIAAHAAA